MKNTTKFFGIIALIAIIGLSVVACGDLSSDNTGEENDGGGGGIPSELVGEWAAKANPSEMLFKITSDGTFTSTGQSGGDFDKISVSGKTVEIKLSGTLVASFDYSISNGEMDITNATSFMAGIAMVKPFVKAGSSNDGGGNTGNGGSLSAIAGKWYKADQLAFEITSAGKLIMNTTSYDISVSGSTATLKFGGTTVGTFDYAVSNDQMLMFNGTAIGLSIVALSPVVKENGDNGGEIVVPEPNEQAFTVTFDANGGSGTVPTAQTANSGSSITLPSGSGLSRVGYTFAGWNTSAAGTGTNYNAGAAFTVNSNVTLYAKWNNSGGNVTPIDPPVNGGEIDDPEIDNPIIWGNNGGENEPVLTLTSVVASEGDSPTGKLIPYLFLQFNRNASLSINDITISGVSGVTKGGLTDTSHGNGTSYVFGLKTNAKTSGTITVSVTKSGQQVNGSPKTVYVYNNSNAAYP